MYDDAARFVACVAAAGIPMALVTNGGDSQRGLIAAAGLEESLAHTFIFSEQGVAKPDPVGLRGMFLALGTNPSQCLHVGDSLEMGVAGPSAAGLHTVWVNRSSRSSRGNTTPPLTVDELDQLSRILG